MDKKGSEEYLKAILKNHIILLEKEKRECIFEEVKKMIILDLEYAKNELAKLD